MNKKKYKWVLILIPMITGGIVGGFIASGNPVIPVIVILAGTFALYKARISVNAVIRDERHFRIGGIAARLTISIVPLLMSLVSIVLIVVRYNEVLTAVGFALAISDLVILFFYIFAIIYYSKKM